jgi:hypothetical protein
MPVNLMNTFRQHVQILTKKWTRYKIMSNCWTHLVYLLHSQVTPKKEKQQGLSALLFPL